MCAGGSGCVKPRGARPAPPATFPHAPGRAPSSHPGLFRAGNWLPPLPIRVDTPRPPDESAGYQGKETGGGHGSQLSAPL